MQAMLRNPYIALNPISEPDMFFGPFGVLNKLLSAVAGKQNVSLIGTRHSGRTTLLRCMTLPDLQKQFGYDFSHHLFIYLDVRFCLRKTCDGFFDFLYEEIIAACQGRIEISLSPKTGEDRFMDLLKQFKSKHFYPVLLLDAFDEIINNKAFDPEFFMFLRAQATAGLVSYVTATIKPLSEISHPAIQSSPFFNIFIVCRVKPLTPNEARNLIMIPSRVAGCPFTEAECAWILGLTGGHPFFIQRACYLLFEGKSSLQEDGNDNDRNLDDLEAAIYDDLASHFAYLWNDLNATQKKEARSKDASKLEQHCPELAGSPIFRRYAASSQKLPPSGALVVDLKEALKHLDSPALLASSSLRQIKPIIERIEKSGAATPFEKGRIIRDFLGERLETLKGIGSRSNTHPTWLAYNILSYTYFNRRSDWDQEKIAGILAISLRQYHREKDAAIVALCDSLHKLEDTKKQDGT